MQILHQKKGLETETGIWVMLSVICLLKRMYGTSNFALYSISFGFIIIKR
jgi:hypothetical protein